MDHPLTPIQEDTTVLHTTVDVIEVSTHCVYRMKLTLSLEFALSHMSYTEGAKTLEASSDANLWCQLSAKLNTKELEEVMRHISQARTTVRSQMEIKVYYY